MADPTYPQRLANLLDLTIRALVGERTDLQSLAVLHEGLNQLLAESAEQIGSSSELHPGRVAQARLSTALPYLSAVLALREGRERAARLFVPLGPSESGLLSLTLAEANGHLRPALHYAEQWARQTEQQGRAA